MSDFVMVTDSCCDLTADQVQEMGLKIVPLTVELEGKSYNHYPDERELSIQTFYQALRDKKVAITSLVNVGTFLTFFEEILKEGKDILYIGFSSALSGTLQSSKVAAEELKKAYPDRKIIIIDSLSASMGQGLLVHYAWTLKKDKKTIEEVQTWTEAHKLNLCHLFTVDDLGTLKRGGRLSDTQAFLGALFRIKPILHVSDEGKLVPIKKARGREYSLSSMVELIKDHTESLKGQTIFISHGDCIEEAEKVGKMIMDIYEPNEIIYNEIGPIIGAHSGPGTIAVFFMGFKR